MKFLAIFFVSLFVIQIQGYSDRMCGAKLSQIMWLVCENGFNSMMKRSGHPNSILPTLDNDLMSSSYDADLMAKLFHNENGNLLAKTRRIRMSGIVDECCKKSCTYQELTAYCLS